MHKSHEALQSEINEAGKKVAVGGSYYHYKNPDRNYKVLHLAVTEFDDELCVVYQAQYGKELIFVRPLKSWLSEVRLDNHIVQRFTLIQ
jgi:hypothetical protein